LKEAAKFHLSGDGLRDVGHTAADDEDTVVTNLRQQLTLAIHVINNSCQYLLFPVLFAQ